MTSTQRTGGRVAPYHTIRLNKPTSRGLAGHQAEKENMTVFAIGRVIRISPKLFIARPNGNITKKRVITLHNDYNDVVVIDLWDEKADDLEDLVEKRVLIDNLRVHRYGDQQVLVSTHSTDVWLAATPKESS